MHELYLRGRRRKFCCSSLWNKVFVLLLSGYSFFPCSPGFNVEFILKSKASYSCGLLNQLQSYQTTQSAVSIPSFPILFIKIKRKLNFKSISVENCPIFHQTEKQRHVLWNRFINLDLLLHLDIEINRWNGNWIEKTFVKHVGWRCQLLVFPFSIWSHCTPAIQTYDNHPTSTDFFKLFSRSWQSNCQFKLDLKTNPVLLYNLLVTLYW